jgi:CRP-like cAMP-binding protein
LQRPERTTPLHLSRSRQANQDQSALEELLKELIQELEPVTQGAALYGLQLKFPQQGEAFARRLALLENIDPWLAEVRNAILEQGTATNLEKLLGLVNSVFFGKFNLTHLIRLAHIAQLRSYRTQEIIYSVGKPAHELLILIEGEVQTLQPKTGKTISQITSGQTIGELGVLTGQPRLVDVQVTSPTVKVLAIEAQAFEQLSLNDPEIARSLLLILGQRLEDTLRQIH